MRASSNKIVGEQCCSSMLICQAFKIPNSADILLSVTLPCRKFRNYCTIARSPHILQDFNKGFHYKLSCLHKNLAESCQKQTQSILRRFLTRVFILLHSTSPGGISVHPSALAPPPGSRPPFSLECANGCKFCTA